MLNTIFEQVSKSLFNLSRTILEFWKLATNCQNSVNQSRCQVKDLLFAIGYPRFEAHGKYAG